MAQQSIVIVVTENGSRVVKRSFDDISASAKGAASSVDLLVHALEAIGIGVAIKDLIEAADTFQNLQNRLTAVGTSASDLADVYARLTQISLETHQSIESTTNLYARLEQGLNSLGYSQTEVLNFTRNLSAAIVLSGASAQETKYAVQDLAHGISAGAINGRELNGILREMPYLATLIAEAVHKPVGSLREMAKEGKLSADALIKGFNGLSEEILAKLAGRALTVGQALTDIKTAFTNWIGEMSRANGVTNTLAQGLEFIVHNMDAIGGALVSVATGFVVFELLPAAINLVTGALIRMTAAALANPFTAMLAIITSVSAALYYFRDEIKLGIDDTTTLGDLMRASFQEILPVINEVEQDVRAFFKALVVQWNESYGKLSNLDWLRILVRGLEGFGLGVMLEIHSLEVAFKTLWYGVGFAFFEMVDMVTSGLDNLGKAVADKITQTAALVGITLKQVAEQNQDGLSNPFRAGLEKAISSGQKAGKDFADGFAQATAGNGGLERALNNLIPNAQKIGQARAAASVDTGDLNKRGKRAELENPNAAKEAAKLEKALEAIENRYDHILKYVNDYNAAMKTINAAVAAKMITPQAGAALGQEIKDDATSKILGNYNKAAEAAHKYQIELRDLKEAVAAHLITQNQANAAMAVATARAKDQINPLGKIYDDMKRLREVMQESTRDQEIDNELQKNKDSLLKDGIILTQQQTAVMRAHIAVLRQESDQYTFQNEVLNRAQDPIRKLQVGIRALNQLMAQGRISSSQYAKELLNLKIAADSTNNTIQGGFKQGLDEIQKKLQDVGSEASGVLVNAFDGFNNAMIKAANGGKNAFKDLAKSVIESVESMCLKILEQIALQTILDILSGGTAAAGGGLQNGSSSLASFGGGGGGGAGGGGGGLGKLLGFATGGSFMVGGNGGTDSQLVAFRASPDEKVSISRPGDQNGQPVVSAPPQVHVKVINSMDPRESLAALRSREGERIILNTIARNPQTVRQAGQ